MKILIALSIVSAFALGVGLDYLDIADRTIGEPLYRLAVGAAIPFSVVLFLKRAAYEGWLRFARWWVPLSIFLIAITPVGGNSWMPLFSLNKEGVTLLMAGLLTAISLVLIVREARRVER